MVIPGVNFGGLLFSGLVAGYIMAFLGCWLEGFLGFPRFDVSQDGVVYLGGEKPGRWIVGIAFHHVDSVLFALLYAAWAYFYLPGPPWLRGLIFGVALGVAVQISIFVGSAGGGRHFKAMPKTPRPILADLILTAIFGLVIGLLYYPPPGP